MARRSDFLRRTVRLLAVIPAWALLASPRLCQASEEDAAARQPIVASRPLGHQVPAEFRLAYKFRPNQDVRMLVVVSSQIRVQKGNHIEDNTIQSVTERHYHVNSVDADGSAVLDLTIDKVKIAYSLNNGPPVTYDTRDSSSPPKGMESVKDCIGKHSQVKVDVHGKVLTLEGSQPNSTDDFLVILPEKPVHVGDEWFDDYEARVQVSKELTQRITLRRRYTLSAVNNNVAILHVATAEVTPVNDPQVLAGMVLLTPKGTVLMDLSQGTLALRDLHCERIEVGVLGAASSIAGISNTRQTLR